MRQFRLFSTLGHIQSMAGWVVRQLLDGPYLADHASFARNPDRVSARTFPEPRSATVYVLDARNLDRAAVGH